MKYNYKKKVKKVELSEFEKGERIKEFEDDAILFRVRIFKQNVTMHRKQLVIDVLHPNKPSLTNFEIRSKISEMFEVQNDVVFVFAMRTTIDGCRSNGFALIYESAELAKKYEPRHRLKKHGIKPNPLPIKKNKRKNKIRFRKDATCA